MTAALVTRAPLAAVVDRDAAEAAFDRMARVFRVEMAPATIARAREALVRELVVGRLVIAETGLPTYTPQDGSPPVTFHPPTGATLAALETHEGAKPTANAYSAMVEMTRAERSTFGRMELADVRVCEKLAILFLQEDATTSLGEPIVAREVAEDEFSRMARAFRLELEEGGDASESATVAEHREIITREIVLGRLVISETGLPTFTPGDGSPAVTFHKPTGAQAMALETYSGGRNFQNIFVAAAGMCRVDRSQFLRMALRDAQRVVRLINLFLVPR